MSLMSDSTAAPEVTSNTAAVCSLFIKESTSVLWHSGKLWMWESSYISVVCCLTLRMFKCGFSLRLSITSVKISLKQTRGVSSVTLCRLLITNSLSVFVTLTHTTHSRWSLQITRIRPGQARTTWPRKATSGKWLMKSATRWVQTWQKA